MADLPSTRDLARALLSLESDPAFVRLAASQSRTNIFRILGTDQRERWHSAFWAWLLDPGGSHGLGDMPLRRLLTHGFDSGPGTLRARRWIPKPVDDDAPPGNALRLSDVLGLRVTRAAVAPGPQTSFGEVTSDRVGRSTQCGDERKSNGDKSRFDILLFVEAEVPGAASNPLALVVVVEVKVNDPYNSEQLVRYSKWLHAEPHPDDIRESPENESFRSLAAELVEAVPPGGAVWCAGFFLDAGKKPLSPAPDTLRSPLPEAFATPWSHVTYAALIEDVLEPALLHPGVDPHSRPMLQAYLDLAAHPDSEVLKMAPSEHELLVRQLIERHRDTFLIIGQVLEKSKAYEGEEDLNQSGTVIRSQASPPKSIPGARDWTKYDVDDGESVRRGLAKRNTAYEAIRALEKEGARMAALRELPGMWDMLLPMPGSLDRNMFIQVARAEVERGGRRGFDERRWFLDTEQLVVQEETSWAISNQWEGDMAKLFGPLIASVPGSRVRVYPTGSGVRAGPTR